MDIADGKKQRTVRVLGALLGESAEAALLRATVRPSIVLHEVNARVDVMPWIREHQPDAVVFGMQDEFALPSAPLIGLCARDHRNCVLIVVCVAPPPRAGALLAASRAGAKVLVAPTIAEVASELTRAGGHSAYSRLPDCAALAPVEPPILRDLLCAASRAVAEDGRVRTLAQHLRISTRTLSRYTQHATLASPRALLSAARLLWACAVMESAYRAPREVARATGFGNTQGLAAAIRRHMRPFVSETQPIQLPLYRDALSYVVNSLGGRLATG